MASTAGDTDSIHRGERATVEIAGNGYQIQLPGCREADFTLDDTAPVVVDSGILVIHDGSGVRLAADLVAIRDEQVSSV